MSRQQGHRFGRAALPYAVACAVLVAAGGAGLVWGTQAKASVGASGGATGGATGGAASAAAAAVALAPAGALPESKALLTKRYAQSCELAVRERKFDRAMEVCLEFTRAQELAGKAHASMAVASMLRENNEAADMALSAKHAEAAAKQNDALGKMIWAYHGLNGHSATALALDQTEVLLTEAQEDGVAKAEILLDSLKQNKECRVQAQVALFELPVFCMGRGELRGALAGLGMREQEQSAGAEREVFLLGKLLPGAKQMTLQYGKQSGSQLLAPVLISYRFGLQEAAMASQTLQRLQASLQKKYGSPLRVESEALGQWRSKDGVLIELKRDASGDLLLNYRHEQRAVALQEQTQAQELRRAQRISALTLKAL
ncbi:hypothetical protein [Roseateles sp.]|uniref:hypothetical protein n=1 Tax=Roseateles sp. TaxID=1971397 RepID=UPI00286C5BFE|nr:hypothetical protein [Roseateles sp.]